MNSFYSSGSEYCGVKIAKQQKERKLVLNLTKAANISARALKPNKPHHVQWLITRKCNYRCRGCNVWTEQDKNELSTDEIKRGLDILRKMGIVEVVFSGGDPLLRNDAEEIIKYASRHFVTTVYDNGSMAAEKVEALRTVDFAAISFDSLNPEKMDYIKGVKGSFEKATHSVETLKKEGVNVAVTPTISQLNIDEIVDLTNHFTAMDVPVWYCLYSYDTSTEENQLFRIGKAQDEFLIKDKQAMVKLCDELIQMKKKNRRILMTDKLLKAMRSLYADNKRTWKCKALEDFFIIDHMGRIGGCHGHNFAGSIFDLPEIWDSKKFSALRRTYQECQQCTYLCYIFYSLHSGPYGNLALAKEQWRNAKLLF
ncbi:MAG: radical SAM protein [Candidatus Bathyarchaeota archaeon]|nr:radical SAM protein [Candidatus Bathyarchaeota archaeon]